MATSLSTTNYEQLSYNGTDGCIVASSSAEKVGFYGKVPVAQRAYTASVHNTTAFASSTAFGAGQLAWQVEVTNTLVGLGVWATA